MCFRGLEMLMMAVQVNMYQKCDETELEIKSADVKWGAVKIIVLHLWII